VFCYALARNCAKRGMIFRIISPPHSAVSLQWSRHYDPPHVTRVIPLSCDCETLMTPFQRTSSSSSSSLSYSHHWRSYAQEWRIFLTKARNTLPVFTVREHGPWTRPVDTGSVYRALQRPMARRFAPSCMFNTHTHTRTHDLISRDNSRVSEQFLNGTSAHYRLFSAINDE